MSERELVPVPGSLEDAREKVESSRNHYNGERPHSTVGNLSPREFAGLAEIAD